MFVTLDKSSGYHETVNYQDYAISPGRFHWQTQNSAAPDTPMGKQYLGSPGNGWKYQLFIRAHRDAPYVACGPVTLKESAGARPMNMVWELTPLSARLSRQFSILRGSWIRMRAMASTTHSAWPSATSTSAFAHSGVFAIDSASFGHMHWPSIISSTSAGSGMGSPAPTSRLLS